MTPTLVNASAVIVAHQFNPSIVSQLWLVENEIVEREELKQGQGSVFSDMMVNVASEKFTMLVTPDQVQFSPNSPPPLSENLVEKRLGQFIRTLPHTPYTACGLNFAWLVEDDELPTHAKSLFFVPESPLHRAFDVDNSRFGGYLSRPFMGGRLKLDVKPLTINLPDGQSSERLQFAFNFHFDVEPVRGVADLMVEHLAKWNSAFTEAETTMKLLEEVL